ncbi:MAG: DNA replication complex GINS family protein [Candidatus Aenigmarchaeota archaeon]|nr:DNA replication complex GINS family protein [Candidatus Aenigmarchaeota archaeon]
MVDLITYETIRAVHRGEKDERLQKLPEGFFSAVSSWIDHKKMERSTSSLLEIENAKTTMDDLINRRQRKIILAALRTIRGEVPPVNMTEDEQKFFDRIVFLFKEFKDNLREKIISYDEIVEEKMKEAKDSLKDLGRKEEIYLNGKTGMISSRPVIAEKEIKPLEETEDNEIIEDISAQINEKIHQEPSAPILKEENLSQKIKLNEEIWQEAEKEMIVSEPINIGVSQIETTQKEITTTPEVVAVQKEIENFNVKLLNDMPRFVGTDLKPYGPFASGEKALLPENIVDLLVMRRVGERIG